MENRRKGKSPFSEKSFLDSRQERKRILFILELDKGGDGGKSMPLCVKVRKGITLYPGEPYLREGTALKRFERGGGSFKKS